MYRWIQDKSREKILIVHWQHRFAFDPDTLSFRVWVYVSGSAFKLVNARAYHHGTMLIDAKLQDLKGVLSNEKVSPKNTLPARHDIRQFCTRRGTTDMRNRRHQVWSQKE